MNSESDEPDEVDVLGELESSSYSDFAIHPRWLLESTSGWYDDCPAPSTSDAWSDREAFVVDYSDREYGDVLADNEIPASMEEVIQMVNTAEPTVKETLFRDDGASIIDRVCNESSSLLYGIPNKNKGFDRNKSKRKKTVGGLSDKSGLSRFTDKKRKRLNITKNKPAAQMEIVTGPGQALPLGKGEQVIKIEKYVPSEGESEIEVDIDGESEDLIKIDKTDIVKTTPEEKETIEIQIPDNLKRVMESLDIPLEELKIDTDEISDLEKLLYPEFFEGRISKTPERYVLIRSHILNCWKQCHPFYLTKTAARHGLRNCGDVNCIGRIHMIMEQLGAINYGCEQTSYIRPLVELIKSSPSTSQMPDNLSDLINSNICDFPRQRKKKIIIDGAGGYTITHTEYGEIYRAISEPKQTRPTKKKPVNLIYCKIFTEDYPPPYCVQLSLSALILMDVHSYTSRAEVMGLLGGHYLSDNKIVSIQRYIPCSSLENSGTHCDMCPVSQSAASETLANSGLETVGWHHSHPLFPPQPSDQDILSQTDLQNAFAPSPFLAIIVSPYWPPGRTYSQFRCFFTRKETGESGTYDVAYKFKTHLQCDIENKNDVEILLSHIKSIHDNRSNDSESFNINMNDVCYTTNMSYLEKCLSSIRHHLCECDAKIDPTLYDSILNGIRNLFQ